METVSRVNTVDEPNAAVRETRKQRPQCPPDDEEGRPFVEPGEFEVSIGGGQPVASGAVSGTVVVRRKSE